MRSPACTASAGDFDSLAASAPTRSPSAPAKRDMLLNRTRNVHVPAIVTASSSYVFVAGWSAFAAGSPLRTVRDARVTTPSIGAYTAASRGGFVNAPLM